MSKKKGGGEAKSSRAASLISSPNQGFIGFGSALASNSDSSSSSSSPSSSSSRSRMSLSDAPVVAAISELPFEMQSAFRSRLTKKDTITKMRALTELDEAFKTLTDAQVSSCVFAYSAAYSRVANDADRNVRCQVRTHTDLYVINIYYELVASVIIKRILNSSAKCVILTLFANAVRR